MALVAITEALDRQAYREALSEIMDGLDTLNVKADKATIELFASLRRQTSDIIGALGDSPSGPMYERTLQGLDQAMTDWGNRWGLDFARLQDEGFNMGEELALAPLEAALPEFNIGRFGPTTDQLRILAQYRADLIGGVTAELNKRVRNEVAGVLVGATSFTDAAKAIGRNLDDPSHFRTMMHRARAIMVTEIGRAQAIGTQAAQERAAEDVPTIRKRWLNAHLPDARATHIAAEARYAENGRTGPIPVDEPFMIAGIPAMYPHDPALPARESVHCHCVSISVMLEPGATPEEMPDPAEPEEELTKADEIRKEEDGEPELTPRQRENRDRYERLAAPMTKPKGWDRMSKKKQLQWIEDQMEADLPIGEEWRTRATLVERKRVGRTYRDGSPVIDPRTGKQRTKMETIRTTVERIKGSDLPTTVDLTGMDPETAFRSMNELRPMARAFPEVAEHLAYVGTYRGQKSLEWKIRSANQFKGEYAHASNDGRRLALNPSPKFYGGDLDTIEKSLRSDWRADWHPVAGVESVIVHEFGHHVENWLSREASRSLIPVGGRADGFGTVSSIKNTLTSEWAIGTHQGPGGFLDISRYATRSIHEGWAETFAAWWYRSREVRWTAMDPDVDVGLRSEISSALPESITGARPRSGNVYDRGAGKGETLLSKFDTFMRFMEGTRLQDLPMYTDLTDYRLLSPADRRAHVELRNQLLDELGGTWGPYDRIDIGLLDS